MPNVASIGCLYNGEMQLHSHGRVRAWAVPCATRICIVTYIPMQSRDNGVPI